MLKREVVFGACKAATPSFAAKIAQIATEQRSEIFLERGNSRLSADSLISILSLDLRRGIRVTVCAEGSDEEQAVARVCALMQGEAD